MKRIKHYILKAALSGLADRRLFCPIPFKYMEINMGGYASLCCYLRKSPGTVRPNNLLAVYNSPSARDIRSSILDGTFRYCDLNHCPHYASGDLPLQKDCAGTPFESIVTQRKTIMESKSVWITFDQRCNLKCISCRNRSLNYAEKEHQNVETLLDVVKVNLSHLDRLGMCGNGDVFASPSLRRFLFNLDASMYPSLKVFLLTNGILFNQEAWNSMEKGRKAIQSVQVSMDAARKETYEKIRIGGSFEKLMANLDFIGRLRRQGVIKEFIISFVVNSMNFMEMDEFVSLGKSLGCDQVYFSFMGDWRSLSNEEYNRLAVHLPSHPLHTEFRRKLDSPVFADPVVLLGNIKRFRTRPILRDSMFS